MRRIESDNIHGMTYQKAKKKSENSMMNLQRWKNRAQELAKTNRGALSNKPFKIAKKKGIRRGYKIQGQLPKIN